jgi:hypothetical protein
MDRAEAEAILDGDRETAVALFCGSASWSRRISGSRLGWPSWSGG